MIRSMICLQRVILQRPPFAASSVFARRSKGVVNEQGGFGELLSWEQHNNSKLIHSHVPAYHITIPIAEPHLKEQIG